MSTFQVQLILKRALGRREHDCCRSCTRAGRDWTAQNAHHARRRQLADQFGSWLLLAGILAFAGGVGLTAWGLS